MSGSIFEVTDKNVQLRAAELRLTREMAVAGEREKHFRRLYEASEDSLKALEKELAGWEARYRAREEFWRGRVAEQAKKVDQAVQERLQATQNMDASKRYFEKGKKADT